MDNPSLKQENLRVVPVGRVGWKTPVAVIAGTGLVALCAHISIPLGFTPVPVTMQPFAVLLLGLLLSPGAAFASLALYLAEGAAGLPVFSPHGLGGVMQLVGPTGGYLMAAPFAAALTSFLARRGPRRFVILVGAAALGSALLLGSGAAWLEWNTHAKFTALFAVSVAPFLVGDAAKILAAALCATLFHAIKKSGRDQTI